MEPTIYKPSIYKGTGIYKGAAGGGGGGAPIPQTFVYKSILGKNYKCIEIDTGIFWPIESLNYIDENIVLTSDFLSESGAAAAYSDYGVDDGNGLDYNKLARTYIKSIVGSNCKEIDSYYYNKLISYARDKIKTWNNNNGNIGDELLADFVKNSSFENYSSWLGLLDLGANVLSNWNGSAWSKYPYGSIYPTYWGVFSDGNNIGNAIHIVDNKTIVYFHGDPGNASAYRMRFFIDEN